MNQVSRFRCLRKKKIKTTKEFKYNEYLTKKFREWYASGGREKLDEAAMRADKAVKEMQKAREPDWSKIHEPMTI